MNTYGIEKLGITAPAKVYRNLEPAILTELALARGEGSLSRTGALVVKTGKYTGRSANDKFIVDTPSVHENIHWGDVNRPIEQDKFNALWDRAAEYMNGKDVFVFDGFAGADAKYAQNFRVVNELASQNLFIHQLIRRFADKAALENFQANYTILCAPGFKCDPERDGVNSEAAIILDYEQHKALIVGTRYAGEIKKTVFSIMNYILPFQGVLPMHCSANVGKDGVSAVFFGLSGTGKTTLSASPDRQLIGDDEHGWTEDGVFNFEGGCYAKCIDLDPEREPDIYNAIKFGAMVENVVMDPETRDFDFEDDSLAVNSRVGYPLDHINNIQPESKGGIPNTVIFLTADAFGVMPPISKLDRNQTMYYFMSGFTSKVAGTEIGIKEPVPTFSTCFGEPFLPLDPAKYASMLADRVEKSGARVFLVNTGWNGTGERTKLKYTRAMVNAALDGSLDEAEFITDSIFGVQVPTTCAGCPDELMVPEKMWGDKDAYHAAAHKLAVMFADNFEKKYSYVDDAIKNAGPQA